MPERYGITHRGYRVEVENDWSLVVSRERLFVDSRLADERSVFWGEARLRGEVRDGEEVRPVTVEVTVGLFGGLERCVLIEGGVEYPMREADEALSEMAGGGHLVVEREGGALVYALPGGSGGRELER